MKTLATTFNTLIWLFLLTFAILILLPLVFMFTASIMDAKEIITMPYRWIPSEIKWANYARAIAGNDGSYQFVRNIANSLIVSISIMVSTIFLSSMVGYGLAKFNFKGRNIVFLAIMATMMIPFETIMIPLFMVALKLGIQDSYRGLIIPFMLNAFAVFQMRQYLLTFPEDILDAARIDGMNEPSIYAKIILPNATPVIATVAVLTFRQQWDTLLWPLLVTQREEMKTIPAYIVKFAAEKYADEGAMMAVAVIASIPVIALFLSLSKYFVGGSSTYAAGKE
ncbi:MAG TPA: carbohydrate ABC transporter permease [Treponemataceae bacterium]|nr:carbohydrate ABC transporter permease [Treponemataceae bacterium]HOQ92075.1 carbohydrate ABC transporter permease [Treponemataceae bacterium]HPM05742.1 carbohydrate ABC transporter permease [Treponemataceae bacterium]